MTRTIIQVPVAVWIWIPVVASVLFGSLGPRLGRRLPPRAATWLLSVGSVIVAAATMAVLALVVFTVAGEVPDVAGIGHWSARRLASGEPFDQGAAVVALAVLAAQIVALGWVGWRRGRALLAAWATCRAIPAPLVVLPDTEPTAFAVPGWPGRIVASRGLLESLEPIERRALLAHEQAHLDGRHDLHLTAVALAAAVNPLLGTIPKALRLATERWADEAAAQATGNRATVAATIEHAASRIRRVPVAGLLTLAAAASDVELRVAALLEGPPRRRLASEATLALLAVLAIAAAVAAGHDIEQLFQAAKGAYTNPAAHS